MLSSVTFEPHGTAGGKSGDPTPNTALMGNPKNWNLIMSNLILSPSVNTQSEPNTNTGVFPLKVEKKTLKLSLEMFPGQSRGTRWEQEPSQRWEISWFAAEKLGNFRRFWLEGVLKKQKEKKKSSLVKMYFSINYHFTQFWSSLFPNYLCSTLTLKFHWVCSDLLYLAMFN